MARIAFSSQCPCGSKIHADVLKPSRPQASRVVIKCPSCKSRFLAKLSVDQTKPGRVFQGHFEIIELSEKACEALKSKAPA